MTRRSHDTNPPRSLAGYRQACTFDLRSDGEIEAWLARLNGEPSSGPGPDAAPAHSSEDALPVREAQPAAGA